MIDFDFHIHSAPHSGCAGQTVKEAVQKAYDSGIKTIAICDHNCIDGLEEARLECGKLGMTLVNGVELSVSVRGISESLDGSVIHVLGYNFKPDRELFASLKAPYDKEAQRQFEEQKEYLKKRGFLISDTVKDSGALKEDLLKKGYFSDKREVKRFLKSEEMLKRFPPKKIPLEKVVDLIHKMGGVAVMAHPNNGEDHVHLTKSQTNKIIEFLAGKGLDGLEVFHYSTVNEEGAVENLLKQAEKYNLIVTLGSDRHYSDNRYGDNYFSMAEKLKSFVYDFGTIKEALCKNRT